MASIRGKKLFLKDQLKAGIPDVRNSPSAGIGHLLENIKKELKQRGCNGFFGLQRRFKIMDDDGNKTLSMGEFKKALKELKLNLSEVDLRALFEHFDADGNESIDFEEFVQGIRDPLSERRLRLVYMAFKVIDKDGSGVVDAREIATMYDASKHPDVLAGRKKPMDVMKEFLETFDVGGVKDGMVTKQEFVNYYTNLSASIDNDDYFELMIRNAWHLSGGEGWCANSSNMRVLVTNSKGIERTVEIQNDLGLDKSDFPGIYRALKSQGEEDIQAINGKKLAISTINGRSSIELAGKTSKIEAVNFKLPQLSRELKVKSTHSPANSPFQAPTLIPLSPNKNNTNTNNSSKTLSPLKKMQEKMRQENAQMLVVSTLLDVLRVQLLSRGASGIIELQRRFADMDADGSGALDYAEFQQALLGGQLAFSEDQLRALFGYFDTDHSGAIEYEELLYGLRGQLSPKLLVLVHQIFDLLDRQGLDAIDPAALIAHFDASRHPEVQARARTPQEVQKEFLDTFDVGGVQPGMITREEFVRYYTNIAAAVNDDDYFETILRSVWHFSEKGKQQLLTGKMKRTSLTTSLGDSIKTAT